MAEEDPWGFDDGADFTAEETPAASAGPADAAVGGGAVADGETRPEMDVPSSADEGNYRKPLTLNKHWVRCVPGHLLSVHNTPIQRIACRAFC